MSGKSGKSQGSIRSPILQVPTPTDIRLKFKPPNTVLSLYTLLNIITSILAYMPFKSPTVNEFKYYREVVRTFIEERSYRLNSICQKQ